MTDYVHPEYVISPSELAAKLDDADTLVVDATFFLIPSKDGFKPESGRGKYVEGHIPGAVFMDHVGFSDMSTGLGFSLPDANVLEDAFRKIGVNNETRIVFYSSGHMMWATRAWWLAYYAGHKKISILNGGLARWKAEGREVESGETNPKTGNFDIDIRSDCFVDKKFVLNAVGSESVCTVNALSPDVYQGTGDHHYGRRGHIPGSLNLFFDELLEDGNFRDASSLKTALNTQGILDAERVVTYCGGGISATIDAFACLLVGKENVAVYDGSMTEWVKDHNLPLKEGNSP